MVRALLSGVVVIAAFAVVNGGYVYRTSCPLASGGTQTSWTYAINDVLPYIRQTSAPCHSHTGTRLALDALGIDRINDSAAAMKAPSLRDTAAAASLSSALNEIIREFARERKVIAPFQAKQKAGTLTQSDMAQIASGLRTGLARFTTIRSKLLGSPGADDADLRTAKRQLLTWLGYQIAADRLFFTTRTKQELANQTQLLSKRIADVGAQLRTSISLVQAKYPDIKGWPLTSN